jgi:hypothetical protein
MAPPMLYTYRQGRMDIQEGHLASRRSLGMRETTVSYRRVNGFASTARAHRRGFSTQKARGKIKRSCDLIRAFSYFIWLFGVVQWRSASGFLWAFYTLMRTGYGIEGLHCRLSMAKSPEAVEAASTSVRTRSLTAISHDVTHLPGIDSMYSIGC